MIPESIEEAIHLVCIGPYGHQTAVAREVIRRRAVTHQDDLPSADAMRQRLNEIGHGDDLTFARALKLLVEAEEACGCFAFTEWLCNRDAVRRHATRAALASMAATASATDASQAPPIRFK